MTKLFDIYRCNICSNIVEVVSNGEGELVCCNQPMEHLTENIATEENKHYAHIENIDNIQKRITFKHESTQEHHIVYVEVISKDKKYLKRKYLEISKEPVLEFKCDCKEGFEVRLYCNRDNVWLTK